MPWHLNFNGAPTESLESNLTGTVSEAWARCLAIWLNSSWNDEDYAHGGRVNDLPFNVHRPRNCPSDETRLGYPFIERFSADYLFLLDRYAHGSSAERLCAFDLLFFLAERLYETDEPLPIELRESKLPLPEGIHADLEYAPIAMEEVLHTFALGEFLTNVPPIQ